MDIGGDRDLRRMNRQSSGPLFVFLLTGLFCMEMEMLPLPVPFRNFLEVLLSCHVMSGCRLCYVCWTLSATPTAHRAVVDK